MFDYLSQIIDRFDDLKYTLLDAQTFDEAHYGFPEIYYKIMETDRLRVDVFKNTFAQYNNLEGATVCEAGVGRLALTQHYLPYIKKAYLIENNPNIIDNIKATLKENNWEDKVELIYGDALTVELPEKVDYLIGELMSVYCANEYQVQIFKHLRQFLKPEGRLIPENILNMAQIGYADFENDHKHYPLLFTRHWPTTIGQQVIVNRINLYEDEEEHIVKATPFRCYLSGTANCVLINSWVQLTEGINFTGTDSLMPPTVVKLEKEVNLIGGEKYTLMADFRYGTSLDVARFWVELA